MGAKQSKRSVDISGKEAENGGEVAAAGAVVEGRVEALADGDALKPQLNGDAHIHEQTDKEKQLDSSTPENEKDATTEKEGKEQEGESEEKPAAPVTNGDSEGKPEAGEASPAPAAEDGKKPKKEKVKKKWSLRSISFSRKDKPKQEKKQKDEEAKTNGEPDKVPEEAAEATPETATNEVTEEVKPEAEAKDEKTPETPVTEPLTNGSSTPEAPAPAAPAAAPAPEHLPVNGLSLEDIKPEAPVEETKEDSKSEEQPTAETTETAPAPEIPVKKEVCAEQMPLETPPPPLPANPPPSSVASFAATTMAPELEGAPLAPPAELTHTETAATVETPVNESNKSEIPAVIKDITESGLPDSKEIEPELPAPVNETIIESPVSPAPVDEVLPVTEIKQELPAVETDIKQESPAVETDIEPQLPVPVTEIEPELPAVVVSIEPELPDPITDIDTELPAPVTENESELPAPLETLPAEILESDLPAPPMELTDLEPEALEEKVAHGINDIPAPIKESILEVSNVREDAIQGQGDQNELGCDQLTVNSKLHGNHEPLTDTLDATDDLPPPPPLDDNDEIVDRELVTDGLLNGKPEATKENIVNSNHISHNEEVNCVITENMNGNMNTEEENLKNKMKDTVGNVVSKVECNGNANAEATAAASSQEPLPVSDKLADLIPEVPVVPELKTETEAHEVALAE